MLILFNTIKHLKPKQVSFRLWYSFRALVGYVPKLIPYKFTNPKIKFEKTIVWNHSYDGNNSFTFLNQKLDFETKINWNESNFGKLWCYNLNYFDYLHQDSMTREEGIRLMVDYLSSESSLTIGIEPYPSSLRIINWIKFVSIHHIQNAEINQHIWSSTQRLTKNLEYHILGNHILENAFALVFATIYFDEKSLWSKGKHLLISQLKEQILDDGAHFERSPMYHQLMCCRVLDVIHLLESNRKDEESTWINELRTIAQKMISWLDKFSFGNGDLPLLHDSSNGINPTSKTIINHAKTLEIYPSKINLKDSNYRKIETRKFELIVDIGGVSPGYQPGHAHSSTANFLLHVNDKALLVDTGCSTYEVCERRTIERSTSSHNCVTINNKNSSEIWSSFRIARRVKIHKIEENNSLLAISFSGYAHQSIIQKRTWEWSENIITITDTVSDSSIVATAHFHFDPEISLVKTKTGYNANSSNMKFEGAINVELTSYNYSPRLNTTIKAPLLNVEFKKKLKTTFIFD